MDSGKDGVTAFAHVEGVGEFVGQANVLKGAGDRHEFTHSDCLDAAIDLACLVADADDHGVAAAVTGIFVKGGKNFVIVGAKAFPLDELRLHGVLSVGDVGEIAYVAKYLRRALESAAGEV